MYLTCGGLAVQGFPRVVQWKATLGQDSEGVVHSASRAGHTRTCGAKGAKFEIVAYGREPPAGWFPRNLMSFVGSINGSVGLSATVLIDKLTIVWDIAEQQETIYKINATGIGPWTLGQAVVADQSTVLPVCPVGTLVQRGQVALNGVTKIMLSFSADNHYFVTSETNQYYEGLPGSLDYEVAYIYHPTSILQVQDVGETKNLMIDGWSLRPAVCLEVGDLGGSMKSPGHEVLFVERWGMDQTLSANDKIISPSAYQYWP